MEPTKTREKVSSRNCHNVIMELKMNEHFVLLCLYDLHVAHKKIFYVDRVVVSERFD